MPFIFLSRLKDVVNFVPGISNLGMYIPDQFRDGFHVRLIQDNIPFARVSGTKEEVLEGQR